MVRGTVVAGDGADSCRGRNCSATLCDCSGVPYALWWCKASIGAEGLQAAGQQQLPAEGAGRNAGLRAYIHPQSLTTQKEEEQHAAFAEVEEPESPDGASEGDHLFRLFVGWVP